MKTPPALHLDLTLYAAMILAVVMAKFAPQTIPVTTAGCVLGFVGILCTCSPTPRLLLVTLFLASFFFSSLVWLALSLWL